MRIRWVCTCVGAAAGPNRTGPEHGGRGIWLERDRRLQQHTNDERACCVVLFSMSMMTVVVAVVVVVVVAADSSEGK